MSGPSGPAGPFPDDEALLRALAGAVAAADPVPADWHRAALGCADWLALDARLAEMAYDSLDDHRPAGTAHSARQEGSERRRLRFGTDDLAVEVEVNVTAEAVRLAGRILATGRAASAPRARVRALLPGESHTTDVGDDGGFRFDELPHAPVSLLVEGEPAIKTGWIVP